MHVITLLCCTLGLLPCGCLDPRHRFLQGLVTSSATASALERRAAARAAAETSSSRSSAQQPQRQPPGSAPCDGLFATSGECSVACIIVRRKSFLTPFCLTSAAHIWRVPCRKICAISAPVHLRLQGQHVQRKPARNLTATFIARRISLCHAAYDCLPSTLCTAWLTGSKYGMRLTDSPHVACSELQ